jgi:hypothetical protein
VSDNHDVEPEAHRLSRTERLGYVCLIHCRHACSTSSLATGHMKPLLAFVARIAEQRPESAVLMTVLTSGMMFQKIESELSRMAGGVSKRVKCVLCFIGNWIAAHPQQSQHHRYRGLNLGKPYDPATVRPRFRRVVAQAARRMHLD